MKILITGAHGLVGRALTQHCRALGDDVITTTRLNLDLTDENAISSVVATAKPDAIINCAAYTDVDGAESNRELCFAVNDRAVGNLAAASKRQNAEFITISTDYVFDGRKEGFYSEQDIALPLSVYGESKLAGEHRAHSENEKSIVVRTGWIFGNDGTNFLCVMDDLLREGKEIRAISDSYGTPTYADDLAIRLRDLVGTNCGPVIHVTNSGNGSSYLGFAKKIAEAGGHDFDLIHPVAGSTLMRKAPRPVNSRLECRIAREFGLAELPHWEDAVNRFLNKKAGLN